MAGWIKIYRDLQDHWLSQDMEKLGRWISLLLMATHETKKVLVGNQLIELKRGQIIASNSFLAEKWDTSERTVLRFLELLEKDSMLHRCTYRKVTILTICNYDSYQEKSKGKRTDTCTDICTDSAPIAHQSVTENKNEKNVKEINITTTACAYTCACEEYAQRYEKENNWAEVALMLHTSIEQCQDLFKEFCSVQKHDGKVWNDYQDFRRHWRIWASKRAFEKPKPQVKERPKGKTIKDLGWL